MYFLLTGIFILILMVGSSLLSVIWLSWSLLRVSFPIYKFNCICGLFFSSPNLTHPHPCLLCLQACCAPGNSSSFPRKKEVLHIGGSFSKEIEASAGFFFLQWSAFVLFRWGFLLFFFPSIFCLLLQIWVHGLSLLCSGFSCSLMNLMAFTCVQCLPFTVVVFFI